MATAGELSTSVQGGSDELVDYACTSCENQNKTIQAVGYCVDCNHFYCKVCLQVHSSIPGLKNHTVLGRNEVKSWGKQKRNEMKSCGKQKKSASMPTEICAQHSGKTLEMCCGNHDLLCCHVCVSLEHRTCKNMDFIPDVAKGIAQNNEFLTVNKSIESVMSDMEQIKTTRQQKKTTLEKSRKDVLQSITDFRNHVNKVFDTLEKKAKDDMETLYKDNDKDIQDDIDACDHFMAKLKQMKQQLDANSATNESQTFIFIKKCQQQMEDGNHLMQELATHRKDRIHFINDPEIETFLARITKLGKIEIISTGPDIKKQKKDKAYTAEQWRDFNVRVKSDKTACLITGSCQMADGTILLTDSKNKKLKRLDATYKLTDHCDLPAAPKAVCCVDQREIAVTETNKAIHFVSVGSKMTITRSIQMKHTVWGLAYRHNQLYVSDEANKIYIYNMSGTCIRTLCKDINGVEMFSYTQHIAVSPDGSKIYVADAHKGLVTLDPSGQHLSTFSDKQLDGAYGVCVANDGSVFLCGIWSENVILVDDEGKQMIGVVGNVNDGIHGPSSVCIDKLKSTMMVTMKEDIVRVFDLK